MKLARYCFSVLPLLLVFTIFGVSGCSTKAVRLYDGPELAGGTEARLLTPKSLRVISVDGRNLRRQLVIKNQEMTYLLAPGKHRIVVQYDYFWARPGVRDSSSNDENTNVETVLSEPVQIDFVVESGQVYQLTHEPVSTFAEAQAMAESMVVFLEDARGQTLARSGPVTEDQPEQLVTGVAAGSATAGQGQAVSQAPASGGAVSVNNGLSNLEAMKVLWNSATAEEKKTFLRWAFK